ncbi:acetyl/propionyl/methylcrotonyl-CoA carboxylase subunit alpha [Polymorphum gilvum]|uniref:Putative Methylcrotonoyl-Coenzyme A carboxylase 1 (Alpha) n=1 Tax=Polymorphum gilvum (strain LMG 25793 / CGMCC 1.9160 / SL003B-26A1) TaxID=991905 RepID=F2IYQ1_POLGS|nr:biotin carboxylase N-terminal domain-containing protein [Polymorphum gilvum]ADZ69498.1 putative Methylcrotonoyl-Coenzyme A carboxylase 1 (alpha) [Polymorphum gilvum SL003B-26A1]
MTVLFNAPRPIRSVLVANRGEIACRVMRTCRRLGLRTVAVHSDADADALHVRSADDSHRIGAGPATESYLDMDAVLAAARASGADAIHPGYGFLSENAAFARRCEEAGIVFIGPTPDAVAAMGSKIEAKRIAVEAGVPTVPGYHGDDQDPVRLAAEAERIGYPVLIKASAGGGGRGMRLVERPQDFAAALETARTEARSAFGDDSVLLERYIANPRHLEVQLVGDSHGNLVHLFERDCSVQRNNQKVLEEAPAPNLPGAVRARLHDTALKLGRAIGYRSAGTVEFIMEAGGSEPYFLEMNTRLQVEHPVTEAITGIDLVEWQLLVAAGLPLPLDQDAIRAVGHAIEARVAAERPEASFQPSIGRIAALQAPVGLRFDTGVEGGSQVTPFYDSMLAKLIAHGPDRSAARDRLEQGLSELSVLGLATNQAFLRDCVARPAFAEGRATTRFLVENFPDGWKPQGVDRLRALAAAIWATRLPAAQSPWQERGGFRVTGARRPASVELELSDDHGTASARLTLGPDGFALRIDDRDIVLGPLDLGSGPVEVGGAPVAFRCADDVVHLSHRGLAASVRLRPAIDVDRSATLSAASDGTVVAPLHGLVTDISVSAGERVEKGRPLMKMEAMKLVHTLVAPIDGTVAALRCAVGDTVPADHHLIEIAPLGEE